MCPYSNEIIFSFLPYFDILRNQSRHSSIYMGIFSGYLETWRARYRQFRSAREEALFGDDIINAVNRNIPITNIPDAARMRSKWGRFLHKLSRQEGVEVSDGNKVELLVGGPETVESMLSAINSAQERVWIETYIFDGSEHVARRFVDVLLRAKSRHCDVVVIMDYIGSISFPWRKELEASGIPVVLFNPFPWSHYVDESAELPIPKAVGPVPFRDHRKILIADNVGFCGSMNLQGEVSLEPNSNPSSSPGFFDLSARLEGPCVAHLANVFRDSLEESKVGILRGPIPIPAKAGSTYVQVLQSNIRKQRRSIQRVLASQIKNASNDVRVASSYFMPPGFLKRALLSTTTKDTTILVSGTTDFSPIPGDLWAQTHALSRFVNRPRTSVSLYSKSHMHAKFTTVDSLFVCLGSYNFDRFSSRRNLESAIGVFDRDIATQAARIHEELCRQSTQQSGLVSNPLARFLHWLAYFVMKTSGRNVFDGFDGIEGSSYSKEERERRNSVLRFGRAEIVAASFPIF